LLEDAVTNPIAAQAAALIFGAFIIALAAILIFLPAPAGEWSPNVRPQRSRHRELQPKRDLLGEFVVIGPEDHRREDLVYQRVYGDRSRIRL